MTISGTGSMQSDLHIQAASRPLAERLFVLPVNYCYFTMHDKLLDDSLSAA